MGLTRHNPPCDDLDCMPCWWDALDREMYSFGPLEGQDKDEPQGGTTE